MLCHTIGELFELLSCNGGRCAAAEVDGAQPQSRLTGYLCGMGDLQMCIRDSEIPEQELTPMERTGFTVVEWGGTDASYMKR